MRYPLAGVMVVLALASAIAFLREYSSSLAMRDTPNRVMEKLVAAPPPVPGSWRGIRTLTLGCFDTQHGLGLRLQPEASKVSVNAHCAESARDIVADAPSVAMAHLVLASSALFFEDTAAFNAGFARAQISAPNEGWQAARRHGLGALYYETLDAGSRQAWTADTALLLGERWSREIVANTFIAYEPLRPQIEGLVAQLSNDDQRHFITLVRRNTRDRAATF